jgi:hypothetical protein
LVLDDRDPCPDKGDKTDTSALQIVINRASTRSTYTVLSRLYRLFTFGFDVDGAILKPRASS